MTREAGASLLGVAPDREDETVAAVRGGLPAEPDVLAISGGVSAGDYDLVEPALEQLGVELLFTKVAIKPGAPLVFGRRKNTLVFGRLSCGCRARAPSPARGWRSSCWPR